MRRLYPTEGVMRSKDKEYRQRNHRPSREHRNPVEHRDIMTRICAQDKCNQPAQAGGIRPETQKPALGETQAQEGPMTVLIYVNTSKQVGDPNHLKVFANADAAETWFEENDAEGVACEHEVLE
jgi:hypothetical protein